MATAEQLEKCVFIYDQRDWHVTIEMGGTAQGKVSRTFIVQSCRIDLAIEVAISEMVEMYCVPDEDGEVHAWVSSVTVMPSPTLIRRHEGNSP